AAGVVAGSRTMTSCRSMTAPGRSVRPTVARTTRPVTMAAWLRTARTRGGTREATRVTTRPIVRGRRRNTPGTRISAGRTNGRPARAHALRPVVARGGNLLLNRLTRATTAIPWTRAARP